MIFPETYIDLEQRNLQARRGEGYLQIGPTGSKIWLFRYTRQGKAREMGLVP